MQPNAKYRQLKRKMLLIINENERIALHLNKARKRIMKLESNKVQLQDKLKQLGGEHVEMDSMSESDEEQQIYLIRHEVDTITSKPHGKQAVEQRHSKQQQQQPVNTAPPVPAKKITLTKSPSDGIHFQPDPNAVLPIPPFNPNIITDSVGSGGGGGANAAASSSTATSANRQSSGVKRKVKRVITDVRKVPKFARNPEDGSPILPMQVGILTLLKLGKIVWDRDSFHNERYIWPVGYTVQRPYPSLKYPDAHTVFTCEIVDGGDGPQFVLVADDDPEQPIVGNSATGAWTAVVKRANLLRGRESSNSASGPDYFGFSHTIVAYLIQNMEGADKCRNYHWQKFMEHDAVQQQQQQQQQQQNKKPAIKIEPTVAMQEDRTDELSEQLDDDNEL